MRHLISFFTLAILTLTLKAQLPGANLDVDRLNVRTAFGPPVQDTLTLPYKLGEMRTRPQDKLWYRYNGNTSGRKWDYIYFGPNLTINPGLNDVLLISNSSGLGMSVGPSTFTSIKIPTLGQVGQVLMATISPDGSLGAQTIPGGGSSINSINGLTATSQFLTVNFNVATSPRFTSTTATHALTLPMVSALDTGLVTPAMKSTWDSKATLPAGGTTAKYLRGDTTWQNFPTIPAAGNFTTSGGGIAITGTWPNLNFDVSSTGTLTGLTGDVTTSGTGAATATISNNVVSYAKMQQVTANRILGNPTGSTANVSEIALNTGTGLSFSSNQLIIDTTSKIATLYDVGLKLNLSDTSSMLSKYLRKTDTITLSNRINLKPNGSGLANQLTYWKAVDTISYIPVAYSSTSGGSLSYNISSVFNGNGSNAPITVNTGFSAAMIINSTDGNTSGLSILGSGTSTYYDAFIARNNNAEAINLRLTNLSTANTGTNKGAAGIEILSSIGAADAYTSYGNSTSSNRFITGITQRYNGSNAYAIGWGANSSFAATTILSNLDQTGNFILTGTGYTILTKGSTSQRPSGVAGMIRYNIDSSAYEFANNSGVWRILGSGSNGGGGTNGALLAANNLGDLLSVSTARNNLGLGSLATLSTINNTNWSGAMLTPLNGGTGLNTSTAANGRLLIGNGNGFTLSGLTNGTPDVFIITNATGSITLAVDTNKLVTRNWLASNPSTISILQVGTGINTIYAAAAGTQIRNKALNGSTDISITRNADSSLTWNSLLTYPMSVTKSGTAVTLTNDLSSPGTNYLYGTSNAGAKQWRDFTTMPVTTNSANGLFPSSYKSRIDSGIVVMNAPPSIAAIGYDSIVTASFNLDTLYHKVFNFQGTSNRITISKANSSLYVNAYTFDIDPSYAGQSSIITLGTITTGVWHGTPLTATYGGVPAGGSTSYVLTKNSGADYDYSWLPSAGGGGGAGLVNNVGSGYRLVQGGISSNIKSLAAGSAITIDSTTNSNALTISIQSIVTSLTGTANQVSVSASTGGVTLSLPSQINTTNLKLSGTLDLDGQTYQAPNGKLDILVQDTTTGLTYRQSYFYIDTTGYAGGSTYLTFNGSKVVMNTTSSSAVGAYTIQGNNTGSSASPTFFTPVLASALFRNQGTTTTILHGNASGNPSWAAVALSTDVSGTLPAANGGSGQSSFTLGDLLYASGTTAISKLAGNTAATLKILSQTGTGSASAAPTWYLPSSVDLNAWFGSTIESTSNKSNTTTLGTSTTLYPTQNAVKVYTDNAISGLSSTYFPLAGGSLTGTGGAGYIGLISQVSAPGTPASGIRLYSSSGTSISFKGTGGAITTIIAAGSGSYTLPDLSGSSDNLVTLASIQTLSNKTLTSPQLNFASNAVGDLYYRNSGGVTSRLAIGSTGQVLTVSGGLPVWQDPPAINSGTYFPSIVNSSNTSIGTISQCTWMRVGNIVHVSGSIIASRITSGTMLLELGLPVVSNMTQATDLSGQSQAEQTSSAGDYLSGAIYGDSSNDAAVLVIRTTNSGNMQMYFEFQYVVK